MATVDPIQEDFLGQLLRALQQRSNFGKDITDEIGRTEAQLDTPNPFSQVFDLDERRALQQGEQRRTQGVLNNLQDQLSQRNQAIGNVAESVNRGFEAARTQSNLDRQFGLDEQRLGLERQRVAQSGARGVGGLTVNQALNQARADRKEEAGIASKEQTRINKLIDKATKMRAQTIKVFDKDDKGKRIVIGERPKHTERSIAKFINKSGGSASELGFGLSAVAARVNEMANNDVPGREIEAFIAEAGYTPKRVEKFIIDNILPPEVPAPAPVEFDRNNNPILSAGQFLSPFQATQRSAPVLFDRNDRPIR